MKIGFVYNLKRDDSVEQAEFDTQDVVDSISNALRSDGSEVLCLEMTRDGNWINKLKESSCDLVFNTSEGFRGIGRESYAPVVFEQLEIPFVGSGAYSCFLTLDKFLTKKVVQSRGVLTPESYFVLSNAEIKTISKELFYPVFIKPNFEGSSKGISKKSLCMDSSEFVKNCIALLEQFPEGILVEKYIDGRDISVPYISGIGEQGILEPVEYKGILSEGHSIYDYDLKNNNSDSVDAVCPADISSEVRSHIVEQMKNIVTSLNVVDMCRVDFRLTAEGEVYFIELNALPSLQPDAGLFKATGLLGLDYNQSIQKILEAAKVRIKIGGHKNSFNRRKLNTEKPNVALVYNLKRKKEGDRSYEDEAEFDSLETIESVAAAIRANGHDPILVEATKELATKLMEHKIDVVFNIAEGIAKQSRESQVPSLCDLLGIEHTGSDAACLSITLNKTLTSKIVSMEGVLAPKSEIIHFKNDYKHSLSYPIIIKPNLEGTSKGIFKNAVVDSKQEMLLYIQEHFTKDTNIIAEEFISGREFTVGVAGNDSLQILGISEIEFKPQSQKYPIYSFEAKLLPNPLDNDVYRVISPPEISKKIKRQLVNSTKKVFQVTGCRDIARVDFRVTQDEKAYFIEVNPLPGLSPGFSDLTILAESNGVSYVKLIGKILKPALKRWRLLKQS